MMELKSISLPDLSKRRNTTMSLSEGFAGASRGDVLASTGLNFAPRPKARSVLRLADQDKVAPELDRILPLYYRTRQMVLQQERQGRAMRTMSQELDAQESIVGREIRHLFPMVFQRFDDGQMHRLMRSMTFMKLSRYRWIFGDDSIADPWPADSGDIAFLLLYGKVALYMDKEAAGVKTEVYRGAVFSQSRRFQICDEYIQPEEYVVGAAQCEDACIVCMITSRVLEVCFADRAFGNKRIAQMVRTVPQLSRVVKSEFEAQKTEGDARKKDRDAAREEDAESNALQFALRDLAKVATAIHVRPGEEVLCEEPLEEVLFVVVKGALEIRGDIQLVQRLESLPPKKVRLRVRVERAEGLKQDSVFDKLDPYVEVTVGDFTTFRTNTEQNAGVNPTFGFEGVLLYSGEAEARFDVRDHDTYGADGMCGHGTVDLTNIKHNARVEVPIQLKRPPKTVFRSEQLFEEDAGVLYVTLWWDTEPITEASRAPKRKTFEDKELFVIKQEEMWGHEQLMLRENFRRTLELAAREMAYSAHLGEFRVVGAQSKGANELITIWKVTEQRFLHFIKHLGRMKQLTQTSRVHALDKQYHLRDILTGLVESWEQEEVAINIRKNMTDMGEPRVEAMDPMEFRDKYRGMRATIYIRNGINITNGSLFAKLDPFVSVQWKVGIGDVRKKKKLRTKVLKDSGPDPIWDDSGYLVYQGESALEISVYDYDPDGVDDLVAVGQIQIEKLVAGFDNMVQLQRPGKGAKKRTIKVMFIAIGVEWEHPPHDPAATLSSIRSGGSTLRKAITAGMQTTGSGSMGGTR